MKIDYSIVIPVYNSENIVSKTVNRVREYMSGLGVSFEVILINDGSSDKSWDVISDLATNYPDVIAINLLKNYGQHNANLCGFHESKGQYVITMDDDLQNPPEEIGKLIDGLHGGYDLVLGSFESKKHSFFRRFGSRVVGWLNRVVFDVKDNLVLSNFRIIHRDVIERICKTQTVSPYIPGLILQNSARRRNVIVKHSPRAEGVSNYTLRKLFRLVANILFNHSTIPLRYAAGFGFLSSAVSFLLGVFYFINTLITGVSIPGWATLVVLLSFFNGVLILILSIIGEYLVRVLREVSGLSSYEISEVVR